MSVIWVYFALQTLGIGCHKSFSQCWHTVCQISDTHFLCVYVCLCVSWWCCLGIGHFSGSRSLTARGYMLVWLGEVTSTVSFCQLSGGVCYPTNLGADCRLRMDLYWTYGVCIYCILNRFLNGILSMSILSLFCFMYKL